MSIVHANKWKVQNPSFIGFTWSAIDIEYSWSSLNNRLEQFAKLSLKDYQRHNRPKSYGWLPWCKRRWQWQNYVIIISFNIIFILYFIPLYGYLDEESVDHDKRGEHGIVQLLQLVKGHLKNVRFLIWELFLTIHIENDNNNQVGRKVDEPARAFVLPPIQRLSRPKSSQLRIPPVEICSVQKSHLWKYVHWINAIRDWGIATKNTFAEILGLNKVANLGSSLQPWSL